MGIAIFDATNLSKMIGITSILIHIILLLYALCGGGIGHVHEAESVATHINEPVSKRCDSLRIVFSGDVMQHMPQIDAVLGDSIYNYDSSLRAIAPLWRDADWAVANFETTISANGRYSGYPMFAAPISIACALRDAGVDHLVLANNHSLDRSIGGVRRTLRVIDSLGMTSTGLYLDSAAATRGTIFEKDGFRVVLLNYTYGTNGIITPRGVWINLIDTLLIESHIEAAWRDSATHVIAMFHWGEEYQSRENAAQRELAMWCRARGVDVVIGSHPHVVQPIDTAARVVYSLGNFVSNQRNRYRDGGISAVVTLFDSGAGPRIEFVPHWVYTPIERGRRRYYVVPASMLGDSVVARDGAFRRSIEDNRAAVGAADEFVM